MGKFTKYFWNILINSHTNYLPKHTTMKSFKYTMELSLIFSVTWIIRIRFWNHLKQIWDLTFTRKCLKFFTTFLINLLMILMTVPFTKCIYNLCLIIWNNSHCTCWPYLHRKTMWIVKIIWKFTLIKNKWWRDSTPKYLP